MTIRTLVAYLLGSRDAILTVASARRVLPLGFVLVSSAGLAREYDGSDLLHEPWHVLLPVAASVATSAILYVLVRWVALKRTDGKPLGHSQSYRAFLGLYWMTAPLAWVYALPVERFLSDVDAARANLWLLGIVSVWRVLLITRVISVVHPISFVTALFLVLWFADTLAVWLTQFLPVPLFVLMGGVRLSPAEQVVQTTAELFVLFGVLSWPVWLVGMVVARVVSIRLGGVSPDAVPDDEDDSQRPVVHSGLFTIAVVALAIGCVALPWTQPPQILRWRVERDYRSGRTDEALRRMSDHARDDFPPGWTPPLAERYPSIVNANRHAAGAEILDAVEAVVRVRPQAWVRDFYVEALRRESLCRYAYSGDLDRLLVVLETLPEGRAVAVAQADELRRCVGKEASTEQQRRLHVLLSPPVAR